MGRIIANLGVTIFVCSLWLTYPLSKGYAKHVSNTQSIEELSDLGLVKTVLNIASPVSLVVDAWEAYERKDLDAVLDLTNDCVDRFGIRAQQMQEDLNDYVTGSEAMIRSYWALNDVATALFIQGKALQDAGRYDEAKKAYEELIRHYSFGQCWDPKGWFWKPAQVAKENLVMIENGVYLDFEDYTSSTLVKKAWGALNGGNIELAQGYVDKCIELYGRRAREMQATLDNYPKNSGDEVFSYWALNDVATAHFIKAKAYMLEGKEREVVREFRIIRDELSFGQCWDPRGWWWKPATEADIWLKTFGERGRDNGTS